MPGRVTFEPFFEVGVLGKGRGLDGLYHAVVLMEQDVAMVDVGARRELVEALLVGLDRLEVDFHELPVRPTCPDLHDPVLALLFRRR